MAMLSEYPTTGEVKEFLLSVMDEADDRKAKINPSLTKQQIWDLYMGIAIMKDDNSPFIEHQGKAYIAVKNINREFGSKEVV